MVLPILVLEQSEPNPAYVQMPREREAVPPPTSKRDKLIRQWRQILGSRAFMTNSGRYRTRASSDWTCEAMAGGDSSVLLHDSEHLTRLLLRRAWAKVPRRQQRLLRLAVRCFDPNRPAIKVAATQVNAAAWLLAAMHWNGCRHPSALWCKPLHPLTGVVRWLIDSVKQDGRSSDNHFGRPH